ncbi:MAG TPA: hypothetical protein PLR99_03265 [Polyangiaceae bacterium]|nr:hypothetical protein [Polyangiaceae bacterium]
MTDSDKTAPNEPPLEAPDEVEQAAAPDLADDRDPADGAEEDLPDDAVGDEAMRKLLKRSLAAPEVPVPDLVSGVQRKLRRRSRGKFYADGWSTARSRVNYVLVSVAMLLVLVIAYLVLGPTGISVR